MCTAVGEEMSVVAAIGAGANDYITKPISIPILRARMAALFDQMAVIDALDTRKTEAERRLLERTRSMLGGANDDASTDAPS
jgi:DNA-binding response OmpR family regulator